MAQLSSLSLTIPTQNPRLCLPHHPQLLPGTSGFSLSISRFSSPTTTSKRKLSLKCRQSDHSEQQSFASDPLPNFYPADSPPDSAPPRVFVGHTIYKGKAALSVGPVAPEFVALNPGAFKISREGSVMLQFAPAAGPSNYDWGRKQVFSLSVTELGTLISLGAKGSCEFFHDPFKGRSDEGQIRKILKVEPLPDGSGYFFNLSVQNKLANVDENIRVPVTKGEYTVLISAFNFLVPYLLGWHAFANNTKPENTGRVRYGGDFEWSR